MGSGAVACRGANIYAPATTVSAGTQSIKGGWLKWVQVHFNLFDYRWVRWLIFRQEVPSYGRGIGITLYSGKERW